MSEILKTENLKHIYSPNTPFVHSALGGIDVSVNTGEMLGIIGHTGSGKSTLIQHFNGLLKPTEGRVLFDGRDIWETKAALREIRFKVGLVFQYPEYQLFDETVYKDISFGPKNMGLSEDEIDARVLMAAQFVGIEKEQLQKVPFDLSGGQKRRVAIAGVIAMSPDVLILDEPTAGLDPQGRIEILNQLKAYHQTSGRTVIIVTHSMEDIAKYADRIIVMAGGLAVMEGTPPEIFSQKEKLERIGLAVPQVTAVFSRLAQLGLPVETSVYTVKYGAALLSAMRKNGAV